MLGRTRALARQLERLISIHLDLHGSCRPAPDVEALAISLVSLACLSRRGLCPSWLTDTPAIKLFRTLAGGPTPHLDTSRFGQYLTRILAPAARLPANSRFIETACELLNSSEALALSGNPLLPGWVDQCLGEKSRKVLAGISADADAQSARSHDIQPSLLPSLTQWYTPEWIGKFLIEETVGRSFIDRPEARPAIIDPACGAGHLLVPALERIVAAQCAQSSLPVDEVLSSVLQNQLFGCDIDSQAVDLAAFCLYLASRQRVPTGELPLPNLCHFNVGAAAALDNACAAIGSLWIGLNVIPPEIAIWKFDVPEPLHLSPFNRQFDVVVTNPPYLSHRLMPREVSSFLKSHYHSGHFDLYGAFLLLAMRLLAPGGRVGMICQQSFMSIQRYKDLRTELTQQCELESIVQLGAGVFAARGGEKVNNAIVVACRRSGAPPDSTDVARRHPEIRCWRVLEPGQKLVAEERGITSLPETRVPHSQFAIISGAPFAFWCPPGIARLFHAHPPMESPDTNITLTNGLFTCNNGKFVKPHWQVPEEDLDQYVPYDKGGGQKWFRTTPYLLHWGKDGSAIREYRARQGQSRKLPGEHFYFKPGITYSYIGTKGFRARLLSPNSIFDIASSALFSDQLNTLYLLGLLNSSLARFLLGVLNPTINFQIGDLRRLPLSIPDDATAKEVITQAATAVDIAQTIDAFDHTSPRYREPVLHSFNGDGNSDRAYRRYTEYIDGLNRIETQCQRAIDDLIFDLYQIASNERAAVESDPWVARERKPLCRPMSFQQCSQQVANSSTRLRT